MCNTILMYRRRILYTLYGAVGSVQRPVWMCGAGDRVGNVTLRTRPPHPHPYSPSLLRVRREGGSPPPPSTSIPVAHKNYLLLLVKMFIELFYKRYNYIQGSDIRRTFWYLPLKWRKYRYAFLEHEYILLKRTLFYHCTISSR